MKRNVNTLRLHDSNGTDMTDGQTEAKKKKRCKEFNNERGVKKL